MSISVNYLIKITLLFISLINSAYGNSLAESEWREIANYPDYGEITFELNDGVYSGRYTSVGDRQSRVFGFKVGEVILKLEQKSSTEFQGKVLLRTSLKYCNRNCDNWVPISMHLDSQAGKLIGKWPQSKLNKVTSKMEFVRWQPYILLQQ